VGRKTANVILNTAFGQPVIAVDTHVFRVANRTGLAPGKNVEEVEKHLMRTVPKAYRQNAHHWLIQHGRNTCKARNPVCTACIINELCEYSEKS
ncbi:MAG: endonuclease III, partial [Gammaproteobacteria bacterium]|nr:endonuclease III [Gammaproteobacteria bacterium]